MSLCKVVIVCGGNVCMWCGPKVGVVAGWMGLAFPSVCWEYSVALQFVI